MPKTLKEIRIKAGETAENARPEDIDYVLAERLNLTPSEFELKQDMVLSDAQLKQANKDIKNLAKGVLRSIFWVTPGFWDIRSWYSAEF